MKKIDVGSYKAEGEAKGGLKNVVGQDADFTFPPVLDPDPDIVWRQRHHPLPLPWSWR